MHGSNAKQARQDIIRLLLRIRTTDNHSTSLGTVPLETTIEQTLAVTQIAIFVGLEYQHDRYLYIFAKGPTSATPVPQVSSKTPLGR